MPWLGRIALLVVGYGAAKFGETQLCKDMVEVVKLGSRQISNDIKKEVNDVKDKLNKKEKTV